MELTTVFTAAPQFTVLHGRTELGRTDPSLLSDREAGPRLLLLAGRSWRVTWIDWKRRRCFVEAAERGGRARWQTGGLPQGASFPLMQAIRQVLLRTDVTRQTWRSAVGNAAVGLCLPEPDSKAIEGLKFNAALPPRLAERTLAARLADPDGATAILNLPQRFLTSSP
ncbi:hypothetical protein ACGFIV_01240 [Sphaerisporangium sp. NPDC049003]